MTSPSPSPGEILTEQQKKLVLLAMGVLGGVAIGHAAVTHLFVVGMEDKERKKVLVAAAGSLVIYSLAKLFDIDERWWNIEKTAEWAEQQLEAGAK
jgi:hypothetical protein